MVFMVELLHEAEVKAFTEVVGLFATREVLIGVEGVFIAVEVDLFLFQGSVPFGTHHFFP